jgi:hypothetical protein
MDNTKNIALLNHQQLFP